MDVLIIRDVLANWLGDDYPGLEDMAETVAESLHAGAPPQ